MKTLQERLTFLHHEFKSAAEVGGSDFSGLRAFRSEHPDVPLSVIYRGQHTYRTDDIHIVPWQQFVERSVTMFAASIPLDAPVNPA